MKIAICADLHFRGKNLEDKKKAWEQAVEKMIEAKVDKVVLAGDVFDNRNIGGRESSMGTVYQAFMDQTCRIVREGISLTIVEGNHEQATGDQLSALEPLRYLAEAGIQVCNDFKGTDENDKVVPSILNCDGCIIAFIPWKKENGNRDSELASWLMEIKKIFDESKDGIYKLVVGHLTVKGAVLNSGISIQGSEFEVTQEQLENLGADFVALGHIHVRQQIRKNIHYVGALSQNNYGEEGNPQGFMLIDTDKRTHEYIGIDAPEYQTLNGWEQFKKPLPKPDDYVKYRFREKPENYDELISNPNITVEIVPDREEVKREVEGVEAGRSEEELLDSYLAHRGWEKLARERMVKRAKELMGTIS